METSKNKNKKKKKVKQIITKQLILPKNILMKEYISIPYKILLKRMNLSLKKRKTLQHQQKIILKVKINQSKMKFQIKKVSSHKNLKKLKMAIRVINKLLALRI